ncbi:hypothetical protein Nepgr_021392 [Nepenthes gracilis]|uniref:Uncharacterized protein n=1 Tax=Nepenthes gracilis TaxID=150966 RepID=A0AAD3T0V6_NEPGR|nr:hypothetical protein Nepgr_021392 [Nepenthes gracilis]
MIVLDGDTIASSPLLRATRRKGLAQRREKRRREKGRAQRREKRTIWSKRLRFAARVGQGLARHRIVLIKNTFAHWMWLIQRQLR